MTAPQSPYQSHVKELKDYYWSYADILRDIGINESTYDQRIMAFMALKLLIDNDKLLFNFEYRDNFGLSEKEYKKYKDKNTKDIFLDIIRNIEKFGREENLHFFHQKSQYNPDKPKNICNYSVPPTINKGNSPLNRSSKAKEEETLCLRQVER
jgi:type I restriction enzyme M protein